MFTKVPDKILKIIDDIGTQGSVPLTRLTVLKKWFERPARLPAFGLWIARKASNRTRETTTPAGDLLNETHALLGTAELPIEQIDRAAVMDLHRRARVIHSDYVKHHWGPVRVIHCWPLLLVEEGLALYIGSASLPTDGYKLAADWAQNYDPKYGNGLNGPSQDKLHELMRYIVSVEAMDVFGETAA